MAQSNHPARVYTKKSLQVMTTITGVGTVIVLPNSAVLLDVLAKHMDRKSASKTLSHLKYRKLVECRETESGQIEYRLTDKALERWKKAEIEDITIKMPLKWDKKWRMVSFDIPVSKKNNTKRAYLISELKKLDFMMLQRSLWIHPFECIEQIGIILNYYGLDDFVSVFTVDNTNFDAKATEHFKKIGLLAD